MKLMTKPAALGLAAICAAAVNAQTIYEPNKSIGDQGISLVGWGSGSVAQAEELAYEGANSIRISSRNYFQGGKIVFAKPIDLSGSFGVKENLLKLMLNMPGAGSPTGAPAGRTGGGGVGLGGGDGDGQGGAPAGLGGGQRGGGQQSVAPSDMKPASRIRVVFTTTDGKHGETYLDTSTSLKDPKGWFSVGIPLQAINGFDKTNKILASMSISLDSVATVYVGQASVVKDATPVFAQPNVRELNLAFGDEFVFVAAGSAGATPVKFIWDFDSTDGLSADAEGSTVKRRFRKEGKFTVTLTAVDIYGLKQPYRTTISVTVNP